MTLRKGDVLVKKAGGKSRRVTVLGKPRVSGSYTVVVVLNMNRDKAAWVMTLDNGNPPEGWEKEERS